MKPTDQIEEPEQLDACVGTLRLHFSLDGDRLRLAVFSDGGRSEIPEPERELSYGETEIRSLVEEIDRCLLGVDRRGRLPEAELLRLKELGKALLGMLIPEDICRFILESQAPNLILQIDEGLVSIPWELLHTGEEFFCIRYSMGRIVSTSQQPLAKSKDLDRRPLKMLLIADPEGDLPAGKEEGISIQRELNEGDSSRELTADLHSEEVTAEFFKSRLSDYELLYFAGRFDSVSDDPSQSGLLLADGEFETGLLLDMAKDFTLPSLVFIHACQSGPTENRSTGAELYSLANAFLAAGVRHYIGGTRDIFDRMSASFAEEFYRQLATSRTVGEALRQARIRSIRRFGEENLAWASYVLYGDPSFRYFEAGAVPAKQPAEKRARSHRRVLFAAAAVLLIAVAGFFLGRHWSEQAARERLAREGFNLIHVGQLSEAEGVFSALEGKSPLYFQGMSAVYLNRGNIEKAEQYLWFAQQKQAGSPYLDLIRADLAFSRRQLDESEMSYRKVLEVKKLEGWQQAECHYGLGRVFLARGEIPQAIDEFDKALNLDPSFIQVYTAKGLALERSGKLRDALDLYRKAAEMNPGDPINAALYRKCRELLNYRESAEYQARVEQQISDLLKTDREAPLPAGERDEWTSQPLYLLFLNLEAKGQFAPSEGEDAYINELISHDLGNSSRIHMVESGLLDRLLQEPQLGGSLPADPLTALRVANILSAQVLITGTLLRSPGELQIILRAADTQENRVVAAASGTCQSDGDPHEMLQTLVDDLEEQVVDAYPVKGLVTKVEPGEIILNVGSAVGVSPGMRFRLMEESEEGVELTVYEVDELTSKAVSSSNEIEIQECWRVEEL